MVSAGMKLIKYLLFIFNLLFFFGGLALIIVGALLQTYFKDYLKFTGDSVSGAAIFIIIVGLVVFLVAFFGCLGAYRENHCMISTFAAFLVMVILVELSVGIAGYAMRNKVESVLEDNMKKAVDEYLSPGSGYPAAWDVAQKEFKCCGPNGPLSWNGTKYTDKNKDSVPDSCCKTMGTDCGKGVLVKNNWNETLWTEGCVAGMEQWAKDHAAMLGGAGIGLAFVEVIGILFACMLARAIKKEYQVV